MFEQDYLIRMLLQFFEAMTRAARKDEEERDPLGAANLLEDAIGNATDMDGGVLLSLAPESIAQVLSVSGVDPNVTQFVARSLLLESVYLTEANQHQLAAVRADQARAIAHEYGFDLPDDPSDFDAITEGLEEAAALGGFSETAGSYQETIGSESDALDRLLAGSGIVLDDPFAGFEEQGYGMPADEEEQDTSFGSFIERD